MQQQEIEANAVYSSIGKIAAYWADIEAILEEILRQLSFGVVEYSHQQDLNTGAIITHMDIRQKAADISFLSLGGKDRRELFAKSKALMDKISNDLRASRNRIVHDEWVVRDREIIRRDRRPRLQRSPGTGEWAVAEFSETRYNDLAWLENEVQKFETTTEELSGLWGEIIDFRLDVEEEIGQLLAQTD